jgi:hypothetical protein
LSFDHEILGAIQNDAISKRIDTARSLGEIVVDSETKAHPQFANARIRTPLLLKTDAAFVANRFRVAQSRVHL